MLIQGKFKTEQNRTMDFEFTTKECKPYLIYHGVRACSEHNIVANLKVNGESIGSIDNIFNDVMFKNARLSGIDKIEFNERDKKIIGDNLLNYIKQDDDLYNYYNSQFIELTSDGLAYEYTYWIDEVIGYEGDLKGILKNVYELSNGYDMYFQENTYLDLLCDELYIEYEESQFESEIA